MPIGVIIDSSSLLLGGLCGALIGPKLKENLKNNLELMLGVSSLTMGINAVIVMQNMPPVILAIVLGCCIGTFICLQEKINVAGKGMQKFVMNFMPQKNNQLSEEAFSASLLTIIVLACSSGTGIYGAFVSGVTGDHTILITKAILDFFTAMIFACNLGAVVSVVAVPQAIILLCLFFAAGAIFPILTPAMINDFKACGGILMIATGLRMLKIKTFPIGDMIPAMVIVMPLSYFWVNFVLTFIH